MRIIKEGHVPEYLHTCKFCGCVFAWDKRDVSGYTDNSEWLYCPFCNGFLEVKRDEPVERGVCFVEVER